MKKFIFTLILPIIAVALGSCEEEESPLLFSTENITDPTNVKIEYYSPDPSCVSKMYWIEANNRASEITIKCTNENSIFIENHEGSVLEEYLCPEGQWKAKIINSNTIIFSFDEFENISEDDPTSVSIGFNVISQTKKGMVRAQINVLRFTQSNQSV